MVWLGFHLFSQSAQFKSVDEAISHLIDPGEKKLGEIPRDLFRPSLAFDLPQAHAMAEEAQLELACARDQAEDLGEVLWRRFL